MLYLYQQGGNDHGFITLFNHTPLNINNTKERKT